MELIVQVAGVERRPRAFASFSCSQEFGKGFCYIVMLVASKLGAPVGSGGCDAGQERRQAACVKGCEVSVEQWDWARRMRACTGMGGHPSLHDGGGM